MNKYQDKWERRSSIRTSPRKYIDFNKIGDFFPSDKKSLLLLPEIIALGEKVKIDILTQSFYKYLDDIINLEDASIISACELVIHKDLIVKYDKQTKLNAYTVIIDEYYHIYMANDMMQQLDERFPELPKLTYPISDSDLALKTIKSKLNTKYHDVFDIIAVCIFETTIVRELVEFFNSPDVHPSIKYYINDHMNDEARHYGYFFDLLCYTWNALPIDCQNEIGLYLGEFVTIYLNITSEKEFNLHLLSLILGDKKNAEILIKKLYPDFEITADVPTVKNLLNVFVKAGIFNNQYVKAGFLKYNLIL